MGGSCGQGRVSKGRVGGVGYGRVGWLVGVGWDGMAWGGEGLERVPLVQL